MLTLAQAQEYLSSQGLALPEFVVSALLASFEDIQDCLEDNYSDETVDLINLYLLQLLTMAQIGRMIGSETAPSGASRSYRYRSLGDSWKTTLALLRRNDPRGCTTALIPDDPFITSHAGMWIAPGGKS